MNVAVVGGGIFGQVIAWRLVLGARLVEPRGVVYFDRAGDDEAATAFRSWLDRGVAPVRDLGGIAEEIAPDEAARRWPGVATGDPARVVLEPAGGFGRPALACRTIARASLATGLVEPIAGARTGTCRIPRARALASIDSPSGPISARRCMDSPTTGRALVLRVGMAPQTLFDAVEREPEGLAIAVEALGVKDISVQLQEIESDANVIYLQQKKLDYMVG